MDIITNDIKLTEFVEEIVLDESSDKNLFILNGEICKTLDYNSYITMVSLFPEMEIPKKFMEKFEKYKEHFSVLVKPSKLSIFMVNINWEGLDWDELVDLTENFLEKNGKEKEYVVLDFEKDEHVSKMKYLLVWFPACDQDYRIDLVRESETSILIENELDKDLFEIFGEDINLSPAE
jgi:hypothetical protein